MALKPLHLGVKRTIWSSKNIEGRIRSSDPETARKKIFERDNHTCQYCGFKSHKYQKIVHKNGFDDDFTPDNCLTACIFCHQCFDLRSVAEMGSGQLIWLPEIGQASLHHIMRALYVARITKGDMGDTARKALKALSERGTEARKRLGTDNPESLAIVMEDFLSHRAYSKATKSINGIRLMPLDKRMIEDDDLEYNQFPQILAYWRSKNGPFYNKMPDTWAQDLAPLLQKVA